MAVNEIYCSAGTFVGRVNGYNHRLVMEHAGQFRCDGFEIMIAGPWHEGGQLREIAREYRAAGLICPVVHADKDIGGLLGRDPDGYTEDYLEIWRQDCEFAAEIGAKKIVTHIWGLPDSDRHMNLIWERFGALWEVARDYELDLVAEGTVCNIGGPLEHMEELARLYPAAGLTIDTRHSQFHGELERTYASPIWVDGNVRHIHVSEYAGGYMDWNAFRTVPEPGKGNVNYPLFFQRVKESGYAGTLTLEAPAVQREEGIDVATLNNCLDFIRNGIS